MTSLRKEDSHEDSRDGPVEQRDKSSAAENGDFGEEIEKWTSSDDIFSIPEAIEIDNRVLSQMENPDSSKLVELPPKREGVELVQEEPLKEPLDLSRIVSSEEYNKGKTHALPLSQGKRIRSIC